MRKRKKATKRVTKRKAKRRLKRVPGSFKRKLRLEIDIPTSTKFVSLNPLGYEFKSQVFIKDNKKRRLLNGPVDFDHAVAIIGFYNDNPKKTLPDWLTGERTPWDGEWEELLKGVEG